MQEDPFEFGFLLPRPRGRNAGILSPSLGVIGDINIKLFCNEMICTIQSNTIMRKNFNVCIKSTDESIQAKLYASIKTLKNVNSVVDDDRELV